MDAATGDDLAQLAVACAAARAGGQEVRRRYGALEHAWKGANDPVTEADLAANRAVLAVLRAGSPGRPILSEESRDDLSRLDSSEVWIVDPLDGTKEYLAGNGEFAVMVGLARRGAAVLGAVYMPATDVMYAGVAGDGSWVERGGGEREALRCAPAETGSLRLVGSRSHADPLLERMRTVLGVSDVMPSGSVGVKCARIAEGDRDLYIHPVPYLREWDTCAPEAVLRGAGGRVTDCLGEALRYNKEEPRQADGIVACGPGALEWVLSRIRPLYEAAAENQAGADTPGEEGIR